LVGVCRRVFSACLSAPVVVKNRSIINHHHLTISSLLCFVDVEANIETKKIFVGLTHGRTHSHSKAQNSQNEKEHNKINKKANTHPFLRIED
jgi:hypothetical protein